MKNIGYLAVFELTKMLRSKSILIYAMLYFMNYIISAIFFRLYGSEGTVLTVGNAQSFPIQHLQASYLYTGVFIAIYVAQIVTAERTQGTIKLILLRTVSRTEYFISRIISILFFSLFITLMMIILSYIVGMIFFGWGNEMVFHSLTAAGLNGIAITLLSGLAFSFVYFVFGLIALVVSMFTSKLLESAIIMGVVLMAGQCFELFLKIKKFSIFHQMYFFSSDILEKSFSYNTMNLAILSVYLLFFGIFGYLIFRRKDLYV